MYIIVSTTTDTKEKAQEIANTLIDKKLAACVQIEPIESSYFREEKIQTKSEYKLAIKTKDTLFDDIAVHIRMLHTDKIPEIIATPITFITESYAQWMESVLRE